MQQVYPYSSQSGSSLIQLADKPSNLYLWSRTCKVTVCILILLLLAWGVAVPLYFLVGPGMVLYPQNTIAMPAKDVSRLSSIQNGTVQNAVNGSVVVMNQRYNPALNNPFSVEYQSFKLQIETLFAVVFNRFTEFNKAAVSSLSPYAGSAIKVQFIILFQKDQTEIKRLVESEFKSYLAKHYSMLGTFQLDMPSLSVKHILNRCAVDNGGCSHLCFWGILSDGFECRCPQNYQLLGDGKTCFPSTMKKVATTSNPCGKTQFSCRSGSCIPHLWLCDGVSDCFLGEDEARHICETGDHLLQQDDVPLFLAQVKSKPDINSPLDGVDTTSAKTNREAQKGIEIPRVIQIAVKDEGSNSDQVPHDTEPVITSHETNNGHLVNMGMPSSNVDVALDVMDGSSAENWYWKDEHLQLSPTKTYTAIPTSTIAPSWYIQSKHVNLRMKSRSTAQRQLIPSLQRRNNPQEKTPFAFFG